MDRCQAHVPEIAQPPVEYHSTNKLRENPCCCVLDADVAIDEGDDVGVGAGHHLPPVPVHLDGDGQEGSNCPQRLPILMKYCQELPRDYSSLSCCQEVKNTAPDDTVYHIVHDNSVE